VASQAARAATAIQDLAVTLGKLLVLRRVKGGIGLTLWAMALRAMVGLEGPEAPEGSQEPEEPVRAAASMWSAGH
jgi:hypothetical protein